MKFDSYPRFLRSDIYRKCVETGECVDDGTLEDGELYIKNSPIKLKKSHSDAEDRCRKSILPWHRKNRYLMNKFTFSIKNILYTV